MALSQTGSIFLKNMASSMLPGPLAGILNAICECESAKEFEEKFNDIKKLAKDALNTIPNYAISSECEYASIVVIYFYNTKMLPEDYETVESSIIEEFELNQQNVKGLEVNSNCFILEGFEPIPKEDWKDNIDIVKEFLWDKYEIKVGAISYI